MGLRGVWFSRGAFTRSFRRRIQAAVHRLYLWFPPPAGQINGSSFPLLCSLLQQDLVFPEANPCHPLTGGRTDASFVLRGYIDLKVENKQCLHCSGLSHFTSPSQMPVSFRDFLLALSVPVTSLLPSCPFACSSRPGVGNRSKQWGLWQAGDHALHDREPSPSLNWTVPKEPGG